MSSLWRWKSRVIRWFLSRSRPRIPSAPMAARGSTGISTSLSTVVPIFTSGTRAVGVSSTPATPCSGRVGPGARASAVAISWQTTDWFAPVLLNRAGPYFFVVDTGAVIRR